MLHNFMTMQPTLLLSILNMKLRDNHANLNDLCRYYDIECTALQQKIAGIGYHYVPQLNQFKPVTD